MFYEERNALNMFVRAHGYTVHCVLVRKWTQSYILFVYKKTPQPIFKPLLNQHNTKVANMVSAVVPASQMWICSVLAAARFEL